MVEEMNYVHFFASSKNLLLSYWQNVDLGPGPNQHTWGAVLLTKFPIISTKHHLLPSPGGELAPAIEAVLNIYGTEVTVVVSHNGQGVYLYRAEGKIVDWELYRGRSVRPRAAEHWVGEDYGRFNTTCLVPWICCY